MAELPFDPNTLNTEQKATYAAMVARRRSHGAPFNGPYAALMNHPELCRRIEELGYYLKFQGHLQRDVYQFVVLSVAREAGAQFEWDDHVQHAAAAGVPDRIIEQLHSNGLSGGEFADPYGLAASVLRSTLRWQDIPAEIQSAAIARYGLLAFVEIVVLSGFYQMFAGINQGFAVARSS